MRKIVFILLSFSSFNLHADYFDGNGLKEIAESTRVQDIGMYRGYVAGVQDVYNGEYFCIPENVKLSQASEIVHSYFKDNPKIWHKAGKTIIAEALNDAFPCKNEAPNK